MKGLQSRRRKDCLPGRPSRARNRFASWSPEIVVACCITIDLCIVTDSEQGEAGKDTTPPGGAGGLRKEEGGARERGLLLLSPSMRQRLGGWRDGPREGGEVRGAMGQVVRPAWPGSDMLLLNESFRLSLLFSPSLSIVCFGETRLVAARLGRPAGQYWLFLCSPLPSGGPPPDVTRVTHAAVTNRGTHFPRQPLPPQADFARSWPAEEQEALLGLAWPCIGLPASPWQPCDFASLPDLPWPLFLAMTHHWEATVRHFLLSPRDPIPPPPTHVLDEALSLLHRNSMTYQTFISETFSYLTQHVAD